MTTEVYRRRLHAAKALRAVFALSPVLAVGVFTLAIAPRPASAEWPAFGRAVATAGGDQFSPAMAADGAGGAILTWVDSRDATVNIFAAHVLASGELDPAWPVNGRALRTNPVALAGEPESPSSQVIVPDGSGGAIVAWQDGRSEATQTDIYAQHILASGVVDPAWPANGTPLCLVRNRQVSPDIVSDQVGGAIVTWMDGRDLGTSSSVDVYSQRVLASGLVDRNWPANGLAVSTAPGPQEFPASVADGAGGAIITWFDLRGTNFDIFAQRVRGSGITDPAWPVNGRALCSNPSDQFNPTITSDGSGGAIVAWDDNRDSSFHPFAHHVFGSGVVDPAWPVDGLSISGSGIQEDFPSLVPDGAGGAIVVWQKRDAFINVHAQHLLATGSTDPAWPVKGRVLAPSDHAQTRAAIVSDGGGGAVVVWQDNFDDLLAQHVLSSGALDLAYPATGRVVCDLPSQQSAAAFVATGAGGAIAAWSDNRNGLDDDLFALQVLEAGTSGVPEPQPPGFTFALPTPNPARGPLTFVFAVEQDAGVRLAIYDTAGRRVRELASGDRPAGKHVVEWDLRDERGEAVSAGIYFARLEIGRLMATRKVVTLR